MRANQACHRVATMCRVLGVSSSGYYTWRSRGRFNRAKHDEALGGTIRAIHEASGGTYGAPRMHAELTANGRRVSRKRVARLMREAGLAGVSRAEARALRAWTRAIVWSRTGSNASSRPMGRIGFGWPT